MLLNKHVVPERHPNDQPKGHSCLCLHDFILLLSSSHKMFQVNRKHLTASTNTKSAPKKNTHQHCRHQSIE